MDLINARTAAELLGVSPKTVARWGNRERLAVHYDEAGRRRYARAEVEALAAKRR